VKYSRRDFNKLSLVAAASSLITPRSSAGYGNVAALFDDGDATDLAQYVRQGLISPTELLEEAIRRVELTNPQINAVSQKHYDFGKSAIESGLPDVAIHADCFDTVLEVLDDIEDLLDTVPTGPRSSYISCLGPPPRSLKIAFTSQAWPRHLSYGSQPNK